MRLKIAMVIISFCILPSCEKQNRNDSKKVLLNLSNGSSDDSDLSNLSPEGKRFARLCAAQGSNNLSVQWYDCIHRICVADMAKSDARADATKAFQANDKRLFAAMGYENMHLTAVGVDLCSDLKPSSSRGTLSDKYLDAGGGDGPLSSECVNAELSYMTKYNRQILTLAPKSSHKSFCNSEITPGE